MPGRPPTSPPFVVPGVVDQLAKIQGSVNALMEAQTQTQTAMSTDEFQKNLSTGAKVLNFLKMLGLAAGVLFGMGIVYHQTIMDNATKADIKAHKEKDFVPLQAEVKELREEMRPVVEGVATLVRREKQEKEVEKQRRLVASHDRQYQQRVEEYATLKAAGQWARKPQKSPEHLELLADLVEMEKKL